MTFRIGKLKRQLFLSAVLLLGIAFPSFASDPLTNFSSNFFKKIKGFSGKFSLEYYDTLREKKDLSSGKVVYKQPGLMHWTYDPPNEMIMVIGSEKIWIVDPILENVAIQRLDQVSQVDSLAFLLKGENIHEHFKNTTPKKKLLDSQPNMDELYLTPLKKNTNLVELQLGVDKKSLAIRQFIIIDPRNNYRKITFSNVAVNPEIQSSIFEYKVPEDMEIIDGKRN